MKNSIIKSVLITGCITVSISVSAQYLSIRDERPKIDKTVKNVFQITFNQEPSNSLNYNVMINNPGQELLNVNLRNQQGQLFQDDTFHRRPSYAMLLDLTRLEDDVYTLSITTNYELFVRKIVITTEELGTRNGQMYLDRKAEILEAK